MRKKQCDATCVSISFGAKTLKGAEHVPQAQSNFAQPMDPPDWNPPFEHLEARRERSATKMSAAPEKKRNMRCDSILRTTRMPLSTEAKTIQLDTIRCLTILTPWIRLLQIGSEFWTERERVFLGSSRSIQCRIRGRGETWTPNDPILSSAPFSPLQSFPISQTNTNNSAVAEPSR